jgi:hypothetical protein
MSSVCPEPWSRFHMPTPIQGESIAVVHLNTTASSKDASLAARMGACLRADVLVVRWCVCALCTLSADSCCASIFRSFSRLTVMAWWVFISLNILPIFSRNTHTPSLIFLPAHYFCALLLSVPCICSLLCVCRSSQCKYPSTRSIACTPSGFACHSPSHFLPSFVRQGPFLLMLRACVWALILDRRQVNQSSTVSGQHGSIYFIYVLLSVFFFSSSRSSL